MEVRPSICPVCNRITETPNSVVRGSNDVMATFTDAAGHLWIVSWREVAA